jgi:formate dehydrogenase subunit delta
LEHIWQFWDPRMRRLIVEHLEAGGAGLGDIAQMAIQQLASRLRAVS